MSPDIREQIYDVVIVGGGGAGLAAAIEARKPVQVAWTRAEEFFYDAFDPAAVVKIVSGIDRKGRISLWDYSVYAAGERGASLFYDIPNSRVRSFRGLSYGPGDARKSLHPFAVGPWRAPGANMNAFAVESQIDTMASAARADPLEFRLRHLKHQRMRSVLQAATDAFGWKAAAAPSGAVIANAVFDATGARIFRLPVTPERLRQAIAAKNATGKPARGS